MVVLDYFDLNDITIIGASLGGMLASPCCSFRETDFESDCMERISEFSGCHSGRSQFLRGKSHETGTDLKRIRTAYGFTQAELA